MALYDFEDEVGKILCEMCCHFLMNQNVNIVLSVYEIALVRCLDVKKMVGGVEDEYGRVKVVVEMVVMCLRDAFGDGCGVVQVFGEYCKMVGDREMFLEMIKDDDRANNLF